MEKIAHLFLDSVLCTKNYVMDFDACAPGVIFFKKKIFGTPILKLAMVKRFKVLILLKNKTNVQNTLSIPQVYPE